MVPPLTERIFDGIRYLVFEKNADTFRPGALKKIMDFLFIIFEKIGYTFRFIVNSYMKMYREIVLQEIKLVTASSNDRILIIGSGAIPATALIIAQEVHARCVTIDTDRNAVAAARQCIHNMDMNTLISVEVGNGASYATDDFDVIFMLYGVKNHTAVLKHLAGNINESTRVVFRSIDDPAENLPDEAYLKQLFDVGDVQRTTVLGPMCSYLLTKK